MINLDYKLMNDKLAEYVAMVKKMRPEPIYYFPYLRRVLGDMWDTVKPEYPMTIKIPKDNAHLLRSDFEPAYEFTIEKPFMMDLVKGEEPRPMWFESTQDEAFLRFGFKNLDARYLSDNKLDMEYIHGFLGGSSGHGKSVTLNAVIASLCFEYAPWELEIHLSDAKIVEFKKYGVGHRIPHIQSIAATSDPDYVVSVLETAFDAMNQRGKIFVNAGASNLKSFRKRTGLALPRVIIIMDEVESTFKMAGKKANKIAELIDGFARLGRAAGYHIIMATQNMSSDIPSSAVGQIRVRMCLGANAKTSEAVLANSAATENVGRIGRLIVNTEAMGGGKTAKDNIKYQTPFLSDDDFEVEMEFLERCCQQTPFKRVMAFYDEEDMKTIKEFSPIIEKAVQRMRMSGELKECAKICLGYPAFVSTDPDQLLKITLDGRDIENIIISSASEDKIKPHLYNITKSLEKQYSVLHYTTNKEMFEYTLGMVGSGEIREADTPMIVSVYNLVRKRMFLLQLETISAGASYNAEKIEAVLQADGVPQSVFGNSLMYKRVAAYKFMQTSAEFKNSWKSVEGILPNTMALYQEYSKCQSITSELTVEKFAKVCIVIGDISKVVGWGRTPKSSLIAELRKIMQDACRVGMVFVIYARTIDGMNELASAMRWAIFDSPDKRDWSRLKTEEPSSKSSRLAVLFDNLDTDNPQKKFKCTLLRPEFGE